MNKFLRIADEAARWALLLGLMYGVTVAAFTRHTGC